MSIKTRGRPGAKYSQAVRLLELYDRVNRGEILRPTEDLADSLCIDKRTLQRDLTILRDVGKLQSTEDGRSGWYLPQERRNWGMTRWNVLGVSLGARATAFLAGPLLASQIQPLLSRLRRSLTPAERHNLEDLEQRVHFTEGGQKLYRLDPDKMRDLESMVDGLLHEHPLELSYLSPRRQARGAASRRMRVHALCLVIHRGGAYFVVDVLDADPPASTSRTLLSLDRLDNVRTDVDAAPCAYPSKFDPREYFKSAFGIWRGDAKHDIRLRIHPRHANAVRERTWHESQALEEQADGSLVLTMRLGALEEVTDWILGMGEHVCVEAPDALIERVKGRLERALAQYTAVRNGDAT